MTRAANYHEFAELPAFTRPVWFGNHADGDRRLLNDADPYKWSGDNEPPAIGAKVRIYMNKLGTGKVIGYFAEYGWLGCLVQLDKPPVWWRKQNPTKPPAHLFGIDLEPRTIAIAKIEKEQNR